MGRLVTLLRRGVLARTVAAAVVLALLAAAVTVVVTARGGTRITAYFPEAVGVYPNTTVRVLGVQVGTVDSATPQGTVVRVDMTVDDDVAVPASASAVVVTPSVVADRYVQLTPVYAGGARMADGAVIPEQRTGTPVEIDQLLANLNTLTTALGPRGANSGGAVSRLVGSGAKTLAGNGKPLAESIHQLGALAATLHGTQGNVYATVENLNRFTHTLADNDAQLSRATTELSSVTAVLAEQRDDLSGALSELATALGAVREFIRDNRARLQSNVDKLDTVTGLLAHQRDALSEALRTAPNALGNLLGAYDPATATIDGRSNLLEFTGGPDGPTLPLPPMDPPPTDTPPTSPPPTSPPPTSPPPTSPAPTSPAPTSGAPR